MGLKGDGDRCVLQRGAKTVAMFCPGTVRRNDVFFGFSSNNTLVMRATLVAVVVVRLGAICCECGLKCLNGHGTELRPAHSEIKGPSLQIFSHYDQSCNLAEQSCCVGPRRKDKMQAGAAHVQPLRQKLEPVSTAVPRKAAQNGHAAGQDGFTSVSPRSPHGTQRD